ncbi:MAG: carbohydrate kinase family protein [Candidatus Cloacimonetes bacterium]|nr:carbohydrate kinase family protein [Candidatus Cloacimonadota bacterium]
MDFRDIVLTCIPRMREDFVPLRALVGFDGFVDEINHVVRERTSSREFSRIETINEFAKRIAGAAGLSANLELVPRQIKLGGNGPIMANALVQLGVEVDYIGALGKPYCHPVFSQFCQAVRRTVSLSQPGFTDALEFRDGKLMLGKMASLADINWEELTRTIEISEIGEMIKNSRLVVFTNWTMLPGLESIMAGFLELMRESRYAPLVFFDLADPQKRTREDIRNVLARISDFAGATEVILGMNKRESDIIAGILAIEEEILSHRAALLRKELRIDNVVIHPVDGAAAADREQQFWLPGPYTPEPVLTTGAGDNFNAGFCLGRITGMELLQCLVLGVFTSGFYVRKGYSPHREELADFMEEWYDRY